MDRACVTTGDRAGLAMGRVLHRGGPWGALASVLSGLLVFAGCREKNEPAPIEAPAPARATDANAKDKVN